MNEKIADELCGTDALDQYAVDHSMIALDGKCLRTKCENDHDLGYELLKRFADIMTKRVESTRLQLLDIYGDRS